MSETDLEARLPCDVALPGVIIRKGCKLSTLLDAIERRRAFPNDARTLDPEAVREALSATPK